MTRFLVSACVITVLLLSSCANLTTPNSDTSNNPPGTAALTITTGRVGMLAKNADIALSRLCISLSAPDENTLYDTASLTGYGEQTVTLSFNNLASLKTWTVNAHTEDINDSIIHESSTTFLVRPRQTTPVSLSMNARFSMLKVRFFPIRDSVTRCAISVDNILKSDSAFAKQSKLGDTVIVGFEYLYTNTSQRIRFDVFGQMWGFDTLLYTGDTLLTALPGVNEAYSVPLKWVGPSLPPPGQATMQVVIGPVGTIVINGNLTSGWPMFHFDAQHRGRCPYLGPQSTNLAWTYAIGSSINSSPSIDKYGTIYVGADNNNLYAINPDGSLKWQFATTGAVYSAPAIASDGTIYIGSLDHKVYAVTSTGSLKWSYSTSSEIYSSPTIGSDGTILIGSMDGKLYALNPDGSLKISFTAEGGIMSSPTIGDNGVIYFGSCNLNIFYALNPDFSLKWKTENHSNVILSTASFSPAGTVVYYGAQDGFFYARYTSDGTLKWKHYGYGGWDGTAAIGSDGTLYVGNSYGELLALNPENGDTIWNDYVTLSVRSSPAIGADGTIYFSSAYGGIFGLNPDGTEKWRITDAPAYGNIYSSPALGGDGKLYVGCGNGMLLAIGGR